MRFKAILTGDPNLKIVAARAKNDLNAIKKTII